jgi:hypothetical protein
MKRLSILLVPLLMILAAAAPPVQAAGNYYEGWDVPDDLAGWIANTVDASVVVVNAGGNPGGYIRSSRNPGGLFPIGATTELPQASGDYAAAGVFEVSFDVMFEQGTFTDAVFRARYQGPANNGWYFPFTADFTPGVWGSYVITFDPTWTDAEAVAAGWVSDGGPETFAQTFGDVYHPEVRIGGTGEPLVAGVDNFRIRACPENTVVLSADFGMDTAGMPPDTTLPGSPLGDTMQLQESSGTVTVETAVGTLTDQPILMDQVPGTGGLDVFFYPAPNGCDLVRVGWNSLARSNDISFMACAIRDPSGFIIASVEYRPDGVLTYNSAGVVGPTLPVTYTPDVDQRFEILVDLTTKTSSLSVDGVAIAGFQNVPFAEAAASGFGRLGFEGGGTGAQQFAIDNIVMTACDCDCDPDTVPPVIEITLSPDVLWPPNHKLVEVCATVTTFDVCDADPDITLDSITSSEDDDGLGDGNTVDDVQGADYGSDDDCFFLRSERSGLGDGRIYTVTYCATDAAGNVTCATAEVTVPHDQSGAAFASTGYADDGTRLLPEAAEFGIVIRSTDMFDVDSVDPEKVFVGNHLGVAAPVRFERLVNDWYGRTDLRFFFPAEAAMRLRGEGNEEIVALRYVTEDGTAYLVDDVFALGPTAESTTGISEPGGARVGLMPAQPNPFRASTEIRYSVTAEGPVNLTVYDVAGRHVRTLYSGTRGPGSYVAAWDGRSDSGVRLGAGIYFLRGDVVGHRAFERLVLLK